MHQLLIKELKEYSYGWLGLGLLLLFVIITYVFLWVFPQSSYVEYGFADTGNYFRWIAYLLLFVIPVLSVQSISRETSLGTFELLRTRGVSWWKIINAKFLAGLIFTALLLLLTSPHLFLVNELATPQGVLSRRMILASAIGVFFLGAVFIVISLAVASAFDQGVLSIFMAIGICFFLYIGLLFLSDLTGLSGRESFQLQSWSLQWQIDQLSQGILKLSTIVLFLSLVTIGLFIGSWSLEKKSI